MLEKMTVLAGELQFLGIWLVVCSVMIRLARIEKRIEKLEKKR